MRTATYIPPAMMSLRNALIKTKPLPISLVTLRLGLLMALHGESENDSTRRT